MIIIFRSDASLDIGIGHIMRCLTLADALRAHGANCQFICREHPGHLLDQIRKRGFSATSLPGCEPGDHRQGETDTSQPAHAHWLGCNWQTDAQQTGEILASLKPDWLVVDHYALDTRWENALRAHYGKLLVIDDLADRPHACDLLLDQNLGRATVDYANLLPEHCSVLAGPRFALLRPEFAALREYSLRRRESPTMKNLLITMGGVDRPNATGQVLESLKACPLPADCKITVVMGGKAPWLDQVREIASTMPWPTEVRIDISDMAQVMADSDLAIGGAGTTSWERCSLGLPAIMVVLAENQWFGARALMAAGAASLIGETCAIGGQLAPAILPLLTGENAVNMSRFASNINDGQGSARVVENMERLGDRIRLMTPDDLHQVLTWRNHPDVRRYMYTQHEITMEEHQRWFERASQDQHKHLLIFEADATPLGFIQFSQLASGTTADWGFYVAPEAPTGYGRRLGRLALDYAFGHLHLHKICGQALAFNERSIHFHRALGFHQEGQLREQHFDGQQYHDVLCFGLLTSEWQPNI